MSRAIPIWAALLLAFASCSVWAQGVVSGQAGKFTVAVASQPSPPVSGQNTLTLTVSDGSKALAGASVSIHIDMTTMPMPADFAAAPGAQPGQYVATVNLSMAGLWRMDVSVQQMAGMKMPGDGSARFMVETGKGVKSAGGRVSLPWTWILLIALGVVVVLLLILRHRIPPGAQGVIVGVITLVVVLLITSAVVRKYRDATTATVLSSATMNMNIQPPAAAVPVVVETVHAAPFQAGATYTGAVAADAEEDVYPRVTGRLAFMPFYPGDSVAPGTVIARLDTAELTAKESQAAAGSLGAQAGVTAAGADLSAAQAGVRKAASAVKQSQAKAAQAQAAVRSAEGALRASQSEISSAQQMEKEAASAVASARSGITQAEEAVKQAEGEVAAAKADETYWAAEVARERKLHEEGAISTEELQRETAQAATAHAMLSQKQAGLRSAQAGLARARQELTQAQARRGAAQAAIAAAQARSEQATADREAAVGALAEAQAEVQGSRAEAQAAGAMVSGAGAKSRMAAASAQQASAVLTEAQTVRGYTTIRASTGGVVTARNVAPGVLVQPGMSILRIAKIDYVRIQVSVSEADAARVQIGQPMTARAVDASVPAIRGRIERVFPARDPSAHTATIEARIPNPGLRLKPGQYVIVDLALGQGATTTISVPTSALIVREGGSYVFVVEGTGAQTVARRRTVTTGRLSNDRTEITQGLREGETVITVGAQNLNDGDAVRLPGTEGGTPATTPPQGGSAPMPPGMKMGRANPDGAIG